MDPEVLETLGKFRLQDREDGEVEINETDTRASRDACKLSLVGRVFRENIVNFTGLKQTMSKLWCVKGELRVIELKPKTFQFVFSKEEERMRALEKRSWTFDNQLLVLVPQKEDVHVDDKAFLSTQMWVQAWYIPLQWLIPKTIWKVGKTLNHVSNVLIPENGSK